MKLSKFNEIYDKYYLMVMKVAVDTLHDYYYAQDICQEVFVQLYANMEQMDIKAVKSWLLVTTRRKAIDYTRKASIKRENINSGIMDHFVEDDFADTSVWSIYGDDLFERLKKKDRQWYEIANRILIGMEAQQSVAEDLGISLSNLRIKLFRTKAWLRKNMKDDQVI